MHKIRKSYRKNVSKIIVIECFDGVLSPYQATNDRKVITTINKKLGLVLATSAVDGEFLFTGELKNLITSYKRYDGEQVGEELFIYVSKH